MTEKGAAQEGLGNSSFLIPNSSFVHAVFHIYNEMNLRYNTL